MDYVIVDGRNRLKALLGFLNNEVPAFGTFLDDWDDPAKLKREYSSLRIHVNNLQTDTEILQWYLDFNAGGLAHTSDEIEKAKALLKKAKRKEAKRK